MNKRLTLTALLSVALGAAMLVAGVFELAGRGWALLAGAAVLFSAGMILLRGLNNGE